MLLCSAGPRDFAVQFEHKDIKSLIWEQVSGDWGLWLPHAVGSFQRWVTPSRSLGHAEWTGKVPGEYKNARYAREGPLPAGTTPAS